MGAYICLFCIQAYHSLEENRQRNTHVEVYRYTVKCAYEDTRILAAHYGVWYTHPVEPLLHCSWSLFDVVVRTSKNKASVTPFYYVVLHPLAPSSSDDITALQASSNCKDTKRFRERIVFSHFSWKKGWKRIGFREILRKPLLFVAYLGYNLLLCSVIFE